METHLQTDKELDNSRAMNEEPPEKEEKMEALAEHVFEKSTLVATDSELC